HLSFILFCSYFFVDALMCLRFLPSFPTRRSSDLELPEELTWDLTKIFSSDQEFDEKYQELTEELKNSDQYKGTLAKGATEFLNALEFVLDVYRKVELIYVYAHLKNDQDTANTTYQALYARAGSLFSKVSEAVSWYEPEVLQLSDEQIWQYFEQEPKLEL